MKKPIKALACGLALCMALSSPVSALAGSITDIFTQSGDSQDGGALDTDTSTGTHTRTNSTPIEIDEEKEYDVVGVAFDKEAVTAIIDDVPENPILTAMVLINPKGDSQSGTESIRVQELMAYEDLTLTIQGRDIKASDVYKNLVFYEDKKVSEDNGIINEDEDGNFKPLVTLEVLGRTWNEDKKEWETNENSDKVKIEGQKSGKTYVSVKLGETYKASALVTVKDYKQEIEFKNENGYSAYQKWTVDMMKELADTYGMDITFRAYTETVNKKTGKITQKTYKTMKADGKLTLSAVTEGKFKDDVVHVTAVAENGKVANTTIKVTAGSPVSNLGKVSSSTNKLTIPSKATGTLSVNAKWKTDASAPRQTTDEIKWESSNEKVVEVTSITPKGKEGTSSFEYGDKFKDGQIADNKKSGSKAESTAQITAVAPGSAKITATTSTGKKTTFTVKVTAPISGFTGIEGTDFLYSGQSEELEAITDPEKTDSTITWKVYDIKTAPEGKEGTVIKSDDSQVKFKSSSYATIKTKKVGTSTAKATLTAKAKNVDKIIYVQATTKVKDKNGKKIVSDYYPVELKKTLVCGDKGKIIYKDTGNPEDAITDSTTSISLYKGKAIDLDVKLKVYNSVDDTANPQTYLGQMKIPGGPSVQDIVTWTSTKPKVATVDPRTGKVNALSGGTAIIKVSVVGVKFGNPSRVATYTDTIKVKVIAPATNIKLNKTETSIAPEKGGSVKLSISQYLPKGCTKETAKWEATYYNENNEKVKTETLAVDKKNVTLKIKTTDGYVAGDRIEITATAQSGATAKATVYIRNASKVVQKIASPITSTKKVSKVQLTIGDKDKKVYAVEGKKIEELKDVNGTSVNGIPLDLSQFFETVSSAKAGKEPESGFYEDITTYTANKKGIVNIVGNKLYPVKAGTVIITAKTPSGKSAKITVVVKDAPTSTAK